MLKEPSIFAEFAMLRTPSKPLSKNNKIVSLFLLLISVTFGLSAVMMNTLSIRWVFYLIVGLLVTDLIFFILFTASLLFESKIIFLPGYSLPRRSLLLCV